MNRTASLLILAIALLATPAFAGEQDTETAAEVAQDELQDALQDVHSRTQSTWGRARATRDAMNALRTDGTLGSDEGQAKMAELRAGLKECQIAVKALRMERRIIIAARRAQGTSALASR